MESKSKYTFVEDTKPNIEHGIEKERSDNKIQNTEANQHLIEEDNHNNVEHSQTSTCDELNNKVSMLTKDPVDLISDRGELTNFPWQNDDQPNDLSNLTEPITPEILNKMSRCAVKLNDNPTLSSKEITVTPSTSRCAYSAKLNSSSKPNYSWHVNKTKEKYSSLLYQHDGIPQRGDSLFANSDDSLSSDLLSESNEGNINNNTTEKCEGENAETVPVENDLVSMYLKSVPSTSTCENLVASSDLVCNQNNTDHPNSLRSQTDENHITISTKNREESPTKFASGEENLLVSNEPENNHPETAADDPILPFYCNMTNDYDDETCVDCEDADEEICTCSNYMSDSQICLNEELQSRASGTLNHRQPLFKVYSKENIAETPSLQRKRKLLEARFNEATGNCSIGRKRIALDIDINQRTPTQTENYSTIERRLTPRTLIPTKDNPPPELENWITQFQRWSHVERLVAVDKLIENCEPTQVRHMMKVIEPQFQRDFISLLPKELALQVLSYLDPKDLLRAAQTCRSWRFLCDDNLLWKEKCKHAQIMAEPNTDKPKRGRAGNMPEILSPWKAAFLRQHIIEMNWRSKPIRQPKILKGHDDHVITCLQFYGNRIVSGSDDNTLKVWSAVSGKCLRTLIGHTGGVWSSQMSGNVIISGSTDRTLKVWNMDSGQCIHTLQGHTSTVRCMHLHGRKVVSGSRDATLRVWDIENGTCLHVLVGHLAAVRCVQYDGKLIVSGAYDYMVKVWNPERQECLHTLQGHTNRVYSLQFDGLHIVSGSLDTSIRVWDAETGSCKHTLMGHQSLTSGMELRQNILVSGNADSTVKVWDITSGQCLQTLSGPNKHQSAVTCLQFNSRFVITSSDDGTVKLWDVKTGDFIRNLVSLDSGGSGGVVWRIRASDTKLICAVGSRNGTEETKLMVLDFDVDGACAKCC